MDASSASHAELLRNAAVGDFVEWWQADRRAGVVRALADYLARFPGQEAAIAREYANLLEPLPAVAATAIGTAEFEPYRLVRLLGHGGQGEVWHAEDTRLGRQVALKVLTAPAPAMAGRVERLRREAQALARLEHPGICAIHEARLDGPRPWLAMQLVEGATLAALLAPRADGRGIDRPELDGWLEFFAAAATALQAAHALGILHRDIKPGNLMRTPTGAPVLLDFGLARDLEATAMALTQSGELFGTLPYMAPEVLAGRAADHRADVYALAVTMYEVLAGRRPFVGATQAALRQAIENGDPTALDRTVPSIGRDLAVVVATAMEREPARRYASAAAFAADLRAVRAGEPIAAVLPGRWVRLRRLVARHPALASSFALLAIGLLVAMVLLTQLTRERTRLLALRQAHVARQIVAEQPGLALFAASEAARTAQHAEINDVIYQALDLCWEEHAVIDDWARTAVESTSVDITEDDRWLVRTVRGGDLQVVDLERGRVVRTLPAAVAGRARVALAAGDAVILGGADGVVRHLDLATGAELHAWPLHAPAGADAAAIAQLVVAPDRRRIASCGVDGRAAVVDLDGRLLATCLGHTGTVTLAAFAPDGRRLATLGGKQVKLPDGDRCVRVFTADTGALLHTFGPFAGHPHWLAWSHDGTRLAIAVDADHVALHDLARGTVAEVPNPCPAQWVGFTADDSALVIASRHGLRVHELASGRLLRVDEDFHGRSVFRGAFSPDGERFAVIAWDDTARLYDTATWQRQRVYRGVMTRPRGMGWNRRGDRL
jgi:eukaryotic-like serine/threonine-protein kinase